MNAWFLDPHVDMCAFVCMCVCVCVCGGGLKKLCVDDCVCMRARVKTARRLEAVSSAL